MINAIDFGLVPNDINFDNSLVFNNLIASLTGDKTIYFPAGAYYFNSKPATISISVTIVGCGLNNSSFIRNYNEADINSALIKSTASLNMSNLSILAAAGKTGGSAIRLDGVGASGSILRDLYITGQTGGTWQIPVVLNGPSTLGVRSVLIDNVELFAATVHLAWFLNPRGLTANFQGYPAGGTVSHAVIQQNAAGDRPSNININTRYLTTLYLYNTDSLTIVSAPSTTVIKTNCTNIKAY